MINLLIKFLGVIIIAVLLIVGIGLYLSPQSALKKADAIVVVSGGETDSRTLAGIALYKQGFAPKLIFSGAAKAGPSNALAMQRIAQAQNVPAEDILLEEEAVDTFENAEFTLDILKRNNWHTIILVTSPYHQRRASLSFAKESKQEDYSLKIINRSAFDSAWRKNGWWADAWARAITLSELQKILFIYVFSK
jgi:uncharacterized SAM-binding protein YcdF (DUF218 family)